MLDEEGRGTCSICGKRNALIGMITWRKNDIVCSWCYLNAKKLHELDEKNELIRLKKTNKIKLTVWELSEWFYG